jgi:epoxyqueuosine reductase
MRDKLHELERWIRRELIPGSRALWYSDTGAILERGWAERAGLGWIGKHSGLLSRERGSWFLLGEVLIDRSLDPDPPLAAEHCGTCTRCLEACPTGALVQPYELDATRCISYLTIETRGELPVEWRDATAGRVFGCDICQDVCPWNRRAAEADDPAWRPREALHAPNLLDLCRLSDEAWRDVIRGSAMRRAGLRRIRRSLAYAAATLGPADRGVALDALDACASADFPEVADAIAWARARFQ